MNKHYQQPDLLTDEQAAEYLAIMPRTLRLWRQTRGIPFIKLSGKVIRYRRGDLDQWMDKFRTAITT